jgi:hypothetical protein
MVQTLAAACVTFMIGWVGCGALLALAPVEYVAQSPHSVTIA